MSVTPLNSSFDNYIRAGWYLVPIPPSTKGPRSPGWNKKENAMPSGSVLPPGFGVGLMHAYSGTMALDIDAWSQAKDMLLEQGIDLDALYSAPDAVTIESGNPGHGKLLYAMPFGMTMPTKKVTYQDSGQSKVAYELRCSSSNGMTVQDVLPPSTHVSTGLQYTWGGRGNWTRLPMCPVEVLALWDDLTKNDASRTIKSHSGPNTSWDEIKSALYAIKPDCPRETWVTVGMALQSAGVEMGQIDYAMNLWDDWSAQSALKYKGTSDIMTCWRSFHATDGITIGSLFHLARLAGWMRPMVDASKMFAAAAPVTPHLVGAYLRPPPPDVDLDMWPKALVKRAMEVAETRGCDPLVPLMAGLGAVCGAADARIRLELMHEYEVPPILWLMTVGEPADKKTPGSKPMFDVLKDIERADIDRHKAELLMWEVKEAVYAGQVKELKMASQNPLEAMANDTPMGVTPLPPKPVATQLIVEDITSQKLVRVADGRPKGLLCYMDEMSGWVKQITDKTSGDDRSAWVKSYEGNSYRYDRVTAGSISLEHFAVSMYGNIQPEVLKRNMDSMGADGLLQRFIPVVLRREYTKRNEPVAPFMSGKSEYDNLIRKIYTIPEYKYKMSPGAYAAFREFQTWYESVKQDERTMRSNNTYMTALGKVEGLTGRLALVFHLIEDPYSLEVSEDIMSRAIKIVKTFIIPSYRYVFNVIGGVNDDSLDQWVISHIIQMAGERETITLSEIRRSARRQIEGIPTMYVDREIMQVMDWLQSQLWVSSVDESKRSVTWAINPKLADIFHDERRKVIDAKQRMLDIFVDVARAEGKLKPGTETKVIGNR